MGNQPDYTQFLQIPRSFVKIQGDSFCTTIGEQNTLPLKRNLSQIYFIENFHRLRGQTMTIVILYINVVNTENRVLIKVIPQ